MKKLKKINLHNLSQAEMASSELNLLRGGSGAYKCACVSICADAICKCVTVGDSGIFTNSASTTEVYMSSSLTEKTNSDQAAATTNKNT